MKAKALFIGMFFLAGTANAFAGTNATAVVAKDFEKAEAKEVLEAKKVDEAFFKATSCTVTVSYANPNGGTITLTVTNTCNDCTQQQACNGAYTVISVIVPG